MLMCMGFCCFWGWLRVSYLGFGLMFGFDFVLGWLFVVC